ncbi:alpha/beta-hydrolase [Trametes elegans]|nr:alpha/beta-hydrolase [Trametes elegans]
MVFSLCSAVLLTVIYLACTVGALDNGTTRGSNTSSVPWVPCDSSISPTASLSCGFLRVPLDYHDSSAGYGLIAVIKANATGERRGTVLLNPGGPGISGIGAVAEYGDQLLDLTGGVYDVLPGEVYCFDSVAEYNTFWNGTLELSGIEFSGNFTDHYDIDALLSQAQLMQAKYEELGQRCLSQPGGRYLPYVGTAATARDIAALADALDGPGSPINFFGLSYGSLLGSWLINMFPERVGKVIIDGIINPVLLATEETPFVWPQHIRDDGKIYEGLVAGCAIAGSEGCPIATQGQSASDVNGDIQGLLQHAYDAVRENSSVPVTGALVRQTLWNAVYDPRTWASFANSTYPALVAGVDAETQAINYTRRSLSTHRTRDGGRNETTSYTSMAIVCADSVDARGTTMEDVFKHLVSVTQNGSQFSTLWGNAYNYCPFWPARAVERYQGPFNKTLANTIFVISSLYDPVTPLAEAQDVVDHLGDSAVLVQQNGFGHTSISVPSTCTNTLILDFFVNGTIPESGTVCQVDEDFELFPGVNTKAIIDVVDSV